MKLNLKVAAVLVMLFGLAGAASAQSANGETGRSWNYGRQELSAEQRANFEAMRKVGWELREELRKENPDKNKARKLFEKELELREAMLADRFEYCLAHHDQSERHCRWYMREGWGNDAWRSLCEEMRKDYPNKTKAREYYAAAAKVRMEKSRERFEEVLKDPYLYFEGRGFHHGPKHRHGCHGWTGGAGYSYRGYCY